MNVELCEHGNKDQDHREPPEYQFRIDEHSRLQVVKDSARQDVDDRARR